MAVDRCDRRAWDELASKADPGFYGRLDWLEAVCELGRTEPCFLIVTVKNSPMLRVALTERRRFGVRLVTTPAIAAYAGWAETVPDDLAPERGQHRQAEAYGELASWCESQASYARLVLPPEVVDVRPFTWRGWDTEHRFTYRIPLAPDRPLSLHTNTRRNLERAEKAGIVTRQVRGQEAAEILMPLLGETFRRQNEPLLAPAGRWHVYLERITALPSVTVTVAYGGEQPLAAAAFGFDEDRAYELLAGTADAGTGNGASVKVLLDAIGDASRRVGEFDFAGANLPSIARFKRGFGGRLVPYAAVTWSASPWARFAATGMGRWKRRVLRAYREAGLSA